MKRFGWAGLMAASLWAGGCETAATLPASRPAAGDQKAVDLLGRRWPRADFGRKGLADAVEQLRRTGGTEILVRWEFLKAAGIAEKTPVSACLPGGTTEEFFRALTAAVDKRLLYLLDDGAVVLTTAADPWAQPRKLTYDIRDILVMPSQNTLDPPGVGQSPPLFGWVWQPAPSREAAARRSQGLFDSPEDDPCSWMFDARPVDWKKRQAELGARIRQRVHPSSWKDAGGAWGKMDFARGCLLVEQVPANQKQILQILAEMRQRQVLVLVESYVVAVDTSDRSFDDFLAGPCRSPMVSRGNGLATAAITDEQMMQFVDRAQTTRPAATRALTRQWFNDGVRRYTTMGHPSGVFIGRCYPDGQDAEPPGIALPLLDGTGVERMELNLPPSEPMAAIPWEPENARTESKPAPSEFAAARPRLCAHVAVDDDQRHITLTARPCGGRVARQEPPIELECFDGHVIARLTVDDCLVVKLPILRRQVLGVRRIKDPATGKIVPQVVEKDLSPCGAIYFLIRPTITYGYYGGRVLRTSIDRLGLSPATQPAREQGHPPAATTRADKP